MIRASILKIIYETLSISTIRKHLEYKLKEAGITENSDKVLEMIQEIHRQHTSCGMHCKLQQEVKAKYRISHEFCKTCAYKQHEGEADEE
jgi:hypothetical protein